MTETHKPMPVAGYIPQPSTKIELVNQNKRTEESILRALDQMQGDADFDQRWLAIARTHIEQGFMALNRAIFRPTRVTLPGDEV